MMTMGHAISLLMADELGFLPERNAALVDLWKAATRKPQRDDAPETPERVLAEAMSTHGLGPKNVDGLIVRIRAEQPAFVDDISKKPLANLQTQEGQQARALLLQALEYRRIDGVSNLEAARAAHAAVVKFGLPENNTIGKQKIVTKGNADVVPWLDVITRVSPVVGQFGPEDPERLRKAFSLAHGVLEGTQESTPKNIFAAALHAESKGNSNIASVMRFGRSVRGEAIPTFTRKRDNAFSVRHALAQTYLNFALDGKAAEFPAFLRATALQMRRDGIDRRVTLRDALDAARMAEQHARGTVDTRLPLLDPESEQKVKDLLHEINKDREDAILHRQDSTYMRQYADWLDRVASLVQLPGALPPQEEAAPPEAEQPAAPEVQEVPKIENEPAAQALKDFYAATAGSSDIQADFYHRKDELKRARMLHSLMPNDPGSKDSVGKQMMRSKIAAEFKALSTISAIHAENMKAIQSLKANATSVALKDPMTGVMFNWPIEPTAAPPEERPVDAPPAQAQAPAEQPPGNLPPQANPLIGSMQKAWETMHGVDVKDLSDKMLEHKAQLGGVLRESDRSRFLSQAQEQVRLAGAAGSEWRKGDVLKKQGGAVAMEQKVMPRDTHSLTDEEQARSRDIGLAGLGLDLERFKSADDVMLAAGLTHGIRSYADLRPDLIKSSPKILAKIGPALPTDHQWFNAIRDALSGTQLVTAGVPRAALHGDKLNASELSHVMNGYVLPLMKLRDDYLDLLQQPAREGKKPIGTVQEPPPLKPRTSGSDKPAPGAPPGQHDATEVPNFPSPIPGLNFGKVKMYPGYTDSGTGKYVHPHYEVILEPDTCYPACPAAQIDTDTSVMYVPVIDEHGHALLYPIIVRSQGIDAPDQKKPGPEWATTPVEDRVRIRDAGTKAVTELLNNSNDVALWVTHKVHDANLNRFLGHRIIETGDGKVVDVEQWLVDKGYAKRTSWFPFEAVKLDNTMVIRQLGALGKKDNPIGERAFEPVTHMSYSNQARYGVGTDMGAHAGHSEALPLVLDPDHPQPIPSGTPKMPPHFGKEDEYLGPGS